MMHHDNNFSSRPAPDGVNVMLMRAVLTLVSEAHVSRAAAHMNMTQPAMSKLLAKVRVMYGDPLLVRTEKGMVPTTRALELASQIRNILRLIDDSVAGTPAFTPATAQAHFRLLASESLTLSFVPSLIKTLQSESPFVTLSIHPPQLLRARQELEESRADFVMSSVRPSYEGLRSVPMFKQKLVVVVSTRHSTIRKQLTLDDYLAFPHAYYAGLEGDTPLIESTVDEVLAQHGLRRTIATWLPSALGSPAIVADTDLIATLPERVAHRFAAALGLRVFEPPLPFPDIEVALYWHERSHLDPAHQWLRSVMRQIALNIRLRT